MNNLKFKKNSATGAIHAFLNGVQYRPYLIGELPNLFAFIYSAEDDKDGISNWFNYKGLTYVPV